MDHRAQDSAAASPDPSIDTLARSLADASPRRAALQQVAAAGAGLIGALGLAAAAAQNDGKGKKSGKAKRAGKGNKAGAAQHGKKCNKSSGRSKGCACDNDDQCNSGRCVDGRCGGKGRGSSGPGDFSNLKVEAELGHLFSVAPGNGGSGTADCDPGELLIGGGFETQPSGYCFPTSMLINGQGKFEVGIACPTAPGTVEVTPLAFCVTTA